MVVVVVEISGVGGVSVRDTSIAGVSVGVTSGSGVVSTPSASGERGEEGRFRHRPFREGRQSTHSMPDLAHEQFAQRPLPLHWQHTGMMLHVRVRVFFFLRVIPRAVRKRTYVRTYVRVYTALAHGDSKLRFTITAMEHEREGEIERLRKRQATTPYRPAKRSRLLEAKLRSKTVSRPPKMTAQLQLLTPRGNPKRVYSTGGSVRQSLGVLWLVAIRLVACTQL